MERNEQQKQLREQYVIALIEAITPLQQSAEDRELTLELLIEAAGMLQDHLRGELQELRMGGD